MRYRLLNQKEDFSEGWSWNLSCTEEGLRVADLESGRPGIYVTPVLDGREAQLQWHRLSVQWDMGRNMALRFRVYGTDRKEEADRAARVLDGLRKVREETGKSGEPDWEERILGPLGPWLYAEFREERDVPLSRARGRYLWAAFVLWGHKPQGGESGGSPVLRRIQVYYPDGSWIRWLPEVYESGPGSFLARYLAMFQILYDGAANHIRKKGRYLDAMGATEEVLYWLAEWLDMDDPYLWEPERLRACLAQGAGMYRTRGTRNGLKQMIVRFTGEEPFILEGMDAGRPWRFTVMVRESAVPDLKSRQSLARIIAAGKPAAMEADLVVLRPLLVLGRAYVGVNSVMSRYPSACLDECARIGWAVL